MNAGAKYILASYMSLFGPFPPHAPLPYVTKTRFNSRISLVDLVGIPTGELPGTYRVTDTSHLGVTNLGASLG